MWGKGRGKEEGEFGGGRGAKSGFFKFRILIYNILIEMFSSKRKFYIEIVWRLSGKNNDYFVATSSLVSKSMINSTAALGMVHW